MEGFSRAQERLENIRAVEPILSALRTVSQASMQTAQRQLTALERYGNDLIELTAWLPHQERPLVAKGVEVQPRALLVALGSDRGLCGPFNRDLADRIPREVDNLETPGREVELWSLGVRLHTASERLDIRPDLAERFSRKAVPDFSKADRLSRLCIERFQTGAIEEVRVLYNRPRKGGQYSITLKRLLPTELDGIREEKRDEFWPPPIIETDPGGLLRRLLIQIVQFRFKQCMLESSAAEHAARYHILEAAAQNTERLSEELEMEVQLARQEAITTEMLDLLAAAGLIKS